MSALLHQTIEPHATKYTYSYTCMYITWENRERKSFTRKEQKNKEEIPATQLVTTAILTPTFLHQYFFRFCYLWIVSLYSIPLLYIFFVELFDNWDSFASCLCISRIPHVEYLIFISFWCQKVWIYYLNILWALLVWSSSIGFKYACLVDCVGLYFWDFRFDLVPVWWGNPWKL